MAASSAPQHHHISNDGETPCPDSPPPPQPTPLFIIINTSLTVTACQRVQRCQKESPVLPQNYPLTAALLKLNQDQGIVSLSCGMKCVLVQTSGAKLIKHVTLLRL